MNSRVVGIISFIAGGLVGAGTAFILLKSKYEQEYNEAAAHMQRVYMDAIAEEKGYKTETDIEGGEDPEVLAKLNREKPDIMETARKVSEDHKFVDYSKQEIKTVAEKEAEAVTPKNEKPEYYTISPEEFGDYDDYGHIYLTYYTDGILADSQDVIIDEDEIAEAIGSDFADYFGEYEDDSVHIRNDHFKCDYQILADTRTFEKALNDKRLV